MDLTGRDLPEERFVQLFAQHERHLRAFVRSTGLDWNAVDEVIQTVSLVMWRKWDQFDPDSDFMAWARVIARFEVLKYRRSMARDRHVFREDLMELLADVSIEQSSQLSNPDYERALDECLDQLPAKSRQLIAAAYQGDRSIKEVAADLDKSATSLYKALDRIRKQLQVCIVNRIEAAR